MHCFVRSYYGVERPRWLFRAPYGFVARDSHAYVVIMETTWGMHVYRSKKNNIFSLFIK